MFEWFLQQRLSTDDADELSEDELPDDFISEDDIDDLLSWGDDVESIVDENSLIEFTPELLKELYNMTR